ncbi:multiple sugar transport system ATP-binding protein [Streptosporangium subroseum]|uniref:Multiple sugar transport system ATP-binding protein n=1 Tax=Streptosporangium subroseum TaxID=106412 RepID=A0A239A846_9ACTN|nr:sn-glycerol-3-phosphate ABC transporter ATP-binding protein UgpC [Streptosporangium subroseum]SNR91258.1 multiple sugar transport system ATP-binding protein [Streptosporangium subroseum]
MARVLYDEATRVYPGSTQPAVDALDLDIADGEFLVLVGPSGCGKSTSLRMLAGLERVDGGRIAIGERDVTHLPPRDRDIAMVFQNYALYPHMSVADNMGFALRVIKVPKDERNRRVLEAARLLDLEEFLDRKPKALSGGQRQRVAMGRAIVREPKVFLMDEPLSNLDAKLRVQTRTQVAALQRRLGTTTVYVTHDQVEAMTMGDRVAVLKDGLLQQVDTPLRLYQQPANVFVAGFIGSPSMNLAEYRVEGEEAVLSGGTRTRLTRETLKALRDEGTDRVILGFRPEAVEVVGDADKDHTTFPVTVTVVEELGSDAFLYGQYADATDPALREETVIARVDPTAPPSKGARVFLRIVPGKEQLFSAGTGLRLPT